MIQMHIADDSRLSTKRIRPNGEENNLVKYGVISVNKEKQLPDIFKLTVDCFEEVFDYLSLKDLAAIGQTCKRMQRIAGHCFQQNFGAAIVTFDGGNFYLDRVRINCFKNFTQNIRVLNIGCPEGYVCSKCKYQMRCMKCNFVRKDQYSRKCVRDVEYRCDENGSNGDATKPPNSLDFITQLKHSTSFKRIQIVTRNLSMARINEMKVFLGKTEDIVIHLNTEDDDHLYDALIDACSNTKYLSVDGDFIRHKCNWMQRIYPKLEHIDLTRLSSKEIPGLKPFLERNTAIKQLFIDMKIFWSNRELFKNINIKLDTLAINYHAGIESHLFSQFLNELYERGFYKMLHIRTYVMQKEMIDEFAKLKGLAKLCIVFCMHPISVGTLTNLEELCVCHSCVVNDLKSLPHILPKLKHIEFVDACSDDILPFIRHAVRVKKLKVSSLSSGLHFDQHNKILDLFALNKEREKLVSAQKIMIYVDDDVYLATKWAMKQTDYRMIEMKRIKSYHL